MTATLSPQFARLGAYPIARLADLLADVTPEGDRSIDLSIGNPRDPLPAMDLTGLADRASWTGYPPLAGVPELIDAYQDWLARRFGVTSRPAAVPLSGSREGLAAVPTLTTGPARPLVAFPDPGYGVYAGAAVLAGGQALPLACVAATGAPDLAQVDDESWQRCAVLFLCHPSNPQGMSLSPDLLVHASALARKHGFILAVDECYIDLYLGDDPPVGILTVCEDLTNLLVFHSLSKRSHAAGLRSAFVVGDEVLIKALMRRRSYSAAGMPRPIQHLSAALWQDDDHAAKHRAEYRRRFEVAAQCLHEAEIAFTLPEAGMFMWLDLAPYGWTGTDFARDLWRTQQIKVMPGAFLTIHSDPSCEPVRLALVDDEDTVRDAVSRVAHAIGPLTSRTGATQG